MDGLGLGQSEQIRTQPRRPGNPAAQWCSDTNFRSETRARLAAALLRRAGLLLLGRAGLFLLSRTRLFLLRGARLLLLGLFLRAASHGRCLLCVAVMILLHSEDRTSPRGSACWPDETRRLPVHTQHHMLLYPDLLYTAITRARRLLVLVGTKKALAIAVRNDVTLRRASRLADRLVGFERPTRHPLTAPEVAR